MGTYLFIGGVRDGAVIDIRDDYSEGRGFYPRPLIQLPANIPKSIRAAMALGDEQVIATSYYRVEELRSDKRTWHFFVETSISTEDAISLLLQHYRPYYGKPVE